MTPYSARSGMRLIQHKKEAYWFYRFLSAGYDRYVNPLFWTERMREQALDAGSLDDRRLETLDAGAGTGFTTAGIVGRIDADRVTMLDQSPHQLARARARPELAQCRKLLGDAEALPFDTDSFDRYVSAGSIEYWPDPQRGIAEAFRVLREGGVALVVGPVPPGDPLLRRLAELWMLFPTEAEYRDWFERAGFTGVELTTVAPDWYRDRRSRYAVAVSAVKPRAGDPPFAAPAAREDLRAPMTLRRRLVFAGRFALGSLAGAVFVPVGAVLALRARFDRRRPAPR
jgi:MPBQ/MSBQ methyltransferase